MWGPEKRQRMKNGLCPPAGHGARGDQTAHGQLQYKMQSTMESPSTPRQGSGDHGSFSEKELSTVGPVGGEGKELEQKCIPGQVQSLRSSGLALSVVELNPPYGRRS